MNELQKLCDKVPSFDNVTAMAVIQAELGKPWQELYAELSPDPIAAASLGQVQPHTPSRRVAACCPSRGMHCHAIMAAILRPRE